MTAGFEPVSACWVCGGTAFSTVHVGRYDFSEYASQDPEIAEYTGCSVRLQRCRACGFAQPDSLPTLPRYFDRMYDQRWSHEWVVREHHATSKDLIFTEILAALSRCRTTGRRLLDIGAHAGRFLRLAREAGWDAEGLELNPRTAAYAAAASGAPVIQQNVYSFEPRHRYDAVTLTDVLEHIPRPLDVLSRVQALLVPGGCIAVKVPNGPAQRLKEGLRERLRPGYTGTLANNLVHVNHFSASSLVLALERAGFRDVVVTTAAPEMPDAAGRRVDRLRRLTFFRMARLIPGGAGLPFAFNLQAYATRA